MEPRLPKLSSKTKAPKSIICEVQQWTTTTVKEAQAAKERFIALDTERCEVFRWESASVEEVVKMKAQESSLKMRCVECKQPVRFQRARLSSGNESPHFEHVERNPACSRSEG